VSAAQVARVWAEALFAAAQERDAAERVGRELGDFVAALAASRPLRRVLDDPRVATVAKQRVVADLCRDAHPLLGRTLQLMLERGRFAVVTEMAAAYASLLDRAAGVLDAEVTVAVELPAPLRGAVARRLEETTGRRVRLTTRIDPEIIGGLVLRVDDKVVDASVRGRLRQLRRRLASAEVRGDES